MDHRIIFNANISARFDLSRQNFIWRTPNSETTRQDDDVVPPTIEFALFSVCHVDSFNWFTEEKFSITRLSTPTYIRGLYPANCSQAEENTNNNWNLLIKTTLPISWARYDQVVNAKLQLRGFARLDLAATAVIKSVYSTPVTDFCWRVSFLWLGSLLYVGGQVMLQVHISQRSCA